MVYCFSETNCDNLLWSHYGDYHKGLCVGFEFPVKYHDDFVLYPVNYEGNFETVRFEEDSNRVLYYWLTKKAPEWKYEQEVRAINLHDNEYCKFDKSNIKEIVFGYKTTEKNKGKLIKTLKQMKYSTELELNEIDIDKSELKLIIKRICT